jgi:hypothetical protein
MVDRAFSRRSKMVRRWDRASSSQAKSRWQSADPDYEPRGMEKAQRGLGYWRIWMWLSDVGGLSLASLDVQSVPHVILDPRCRYADACSFGH